MTDRELLESLYVINKHAKQYAEQGTENYKKGNKSTARLNSVKKDALYAVKSKILDELKEETTDIELHKINNQLYYCFIFDEFTFHSPISEHSIQIDSDPKQLDNFNSSSNKNTSRSLKDSLIYIKNTTSYNANDFLAQKYISYPSGSYFSGWDYL